MERVHDQSLTQLNNSLVIYIEFMNIKIKN